MVAGVGGTGIVRFHLESVGLRDLAEPGARTLTLRKYECSVHDRGTVRVEPVALVSRLLHRFRETEIEDLHAAVSCFDFDVRRLEIAMNDPRLVRRVQ